MFENIDFMSYGGTIIYYAVLAVVIFIWCGFLWFVLYYLKFKIKMTYFPVIGSGKVTEIVDRPRKNRLKWNATKTHWIALYPLFNKKEIEPFPQSNTYAGGNVFALKMDEEYVPMTITIGDADKGEVVMKPIPYYARRWQLLQLKQNEIEFTKKNWWDDNKTYIVALFTVACCCAVAALTVWWSYQYAATGLGAVKVASQSFVDTAIQGVATQGVAPA